MGLHKLVLVHALSGFGHSTMSVILPVVSAMGIQGCPLPTAILSNHTGFPDWYKFNTTEHMEEYVQAWNRLELSFDGIYSGYLGCGTQAQALLHLIKAHPESTFFLDPVLGDHGRLYSAITPEHVAAMRELTAHAQYLLPNITEACILTDTDYKEEFTEPEIAVIIDKLHALGPSHIIITGIRQGNMLVNYLSEAPGNIDTVALPVAGNARPGTGDIFGSVLISCILKGQPLKQGVLKAARFVAECIRLSDEYHLPVKEGTCFELLLPTLVSPQE